jgi:hydrogenase expression/formation protein HypC
MCLGIPGQVVRVLDGYGGQLALVDVSGAERKVNIGMLDVGEQDLSPGDWVLIHLGFAVERIDAAGAKEALNGLELMGRPRDASATPPGAEPFGRTSDA